MATCLPEPADERHRSRGVDSARGPGAVPFGCVSIHRLQRAMHKAERLCVGLLSGTSADAARRNAMLVDWENAPSARLAHPREDHLLPLTVAAGAAGNDVGKRVFVDEVANVAMASYMFG